MTNEEIIKEIEQIKQRNQSVELDKAWETSYLRKILIAIFTYLSIKYLLMGDHHLSPLAKRHCADDWISSFNRNVALV